jgi:hypothetical protein
MNDIKILEKTLNILFKKKYDFIKEVKIIRSIHLFTRLNLDLNIYIENEFIEDNLNFECINNMDDYFFSIFSWNYCSDVKLDEKYIKRSIMELFKTLNLDKGNDLYTNSISISIIGYEKLF